MTKEAKVEFDSPRLKQLVDELAAGKDDALECFWRDVKVAGIPFIETRLIPKKNAEGKDELVEDEEFVWVSFLYEGDETIERVSLRSMFMYHDFEQSPEHFIIKHLPETNVWYWTEKLPKDLRLQYWLCANDPLYTDESLDSEEKQEEYFRITAKIDSANPKFLHYHADPDDPADFDIQVSVFEGPNTKPQSHIHERDSIPKGQLRSFQFESKILGNTRKNWVYTPPNYDPRRPEPYPFLLVFDGYIYIDIVPTPTILDNLLAEGKIPATVCLIMNNVKGQRGIELPPNEKMPEALANELIPYMREHYHISHDAAQSTIAGSSYGGLAAAWNAFKNPQLFGNVLSQSGSFSWCQAFELPESKNPDDIELGWLIRQFASSEKLPIKFYLDSGRLETISLIQQGASPLSMNRHMRDVLRAKGYSFHYVEFSGGHDYAWWRQTLADGLISLHEMAKAS